MASIELIKRWKITTALLQRARSAIPLPAEDVSAKVTKLEREFDEFIEHNEFELALDMLEEISYLVSCRGGFWRDLERAAVAMKLTKRAQRFREQFLSAKS